MNIPEFYLIEPYNAYATKGRKKHWHEVIEEQALLERIIAEQQAIQEAASRTLPPNSPATSTAIVGNPAGGAGGVPVYPYFHPELDVLGFTATPLTGDGPLTVNFTNLTTTPQFDTYLWKFGDGTTSTDVDPVHVYQTGSSATGYTVQLTASYDQGASNMTSSIAYISASKPTVTPAFTSSVVTGDAPLIITFDNTSTDTSQTPNTKYLWLFGSASVTSTDKNPTVTYYNSGKYSVILQTTGSYSSSYITKTEYISASIDPFYNNLTLS